MSEANGVDRRVGGDTAIYALFDPDGKLRRSVGRGDCAVTANV